MVSDRPWPFWGRAKAMSPIVRHESRRVLRSAAP